MRKGPDKIKWKGRRRKRGNDEGRRKEREWRGNVRGSVKMQEQNGTKKENKKRKEKRVPGLRGIKARSIEEKIQKKESGLTEINI